MLKNKGNAFNIIDVTNANPLNSLPQHTDSHLATDMSFEAAIELMHQLLTRLAHASPDDSTAISNSLCQLIQTKRGARGFFVGYLTSANPIADQPHPLIIEALQSKSGIVADLIVKNLAMSSAMTIVHQRQGNLENLKGAKQVQERTQNLIVALKIQEIAEHMNAMLSSLNENAGVYQSFFKQQNYDVEQLEAIRLVFKTFMKSKHD